MNPEKYKTGIEKLNISEDFNDKTIDLLQTVFNKDHKKNRSPKRNKRMWSYAIIVVCVLTVALFYPSLITNSTIDLKLSSGKVSVYYVDSAPNTQSSSALEHLTEEEIFNKFNTSIVRGTVEAIQNIKISFGKTSELYQSIATIKISTVFRGDEKSGNIIKILLPASIGTGLWVEDTEIVTALRVGTEGIFMPIKYDGTEMRIENGATLYWKDISDYGLPDGERFVFLQTDQGLIYSKDAYKTLSGASTLEDIEKYVLQMIQTS